MHAAHTIGLLAGLALGITGTSAQESASGFRFTPFHVDHLVKGNGFPPGALAFGYDHDLGEHLSVSLEVTVLWRNVLDSDPSEERGPTPDGLEYGGWHASFEQDTRSWGMTYRTAFFPSGNSDGGIYLGSFLGLRRISRTLVITSQDDNGYASLPDPPFNKKYTAEKMVVPLGLRFGYRSGMDGLYYDFYVGIGYQLGGGKNLFAEPEMAGAPTTLAGFTYTLGYAYGIGW